MYLVTELMKSPRTINFGHNMITKELNVVCAINAIKISRVTVIQLSHQVSGASFAADQCIV
jgi:hypothetical protein